MREREGKRTKGVDSETCWDESVDFTRTRMNCLEVNGVSLYKLRYRLKSIGVQYRLR